MKTTQATQKPPYNEWIAYIHANVKKQIIEWPSKSKLHEKNKRLL